MSWATVLVPTPHTTKSPPFHYLPGTSKMHLILDFDGTITAKDTIATLAHVGVSFQKQDGRDLAPAWDDVVQKYAADYQGHVSRYQPKEADRTTLEAEFAFLRSLREVETRSVRRVGESRLFRGMTQPGLFAAGRDAVRNGDVQLRTGFRDFLHTALQERECKVSVVSVNWSASFIRGVVDDPAVTVIANDISADGEVVGPNLPRRGNGEKAKDGRGAGSLLIATSADKLEAMRALIAARSDGQEREQVVYFGDSATDLECLAAVSGVVLSDDEDGKLLRTLRRLGVGVAHVAAVAALHAGGSGMIWARDFREIQDVGLGKLFLASQ